MKQIKIDKAKKDKVKLIELGDYKLGSQHVTNLHYSSKHSILWMEIGRRIKVFQFKQPSLRIIGSIFDSGGHFSNLFSMNGQRMFITGNSIGKCKVFQLSNMRQSRYLYQLQGHHGCISCIAMNNLEDDLITSSVNSKIKFWSKNNIWRCYQNLIQHTNPLLGFSLNENGDQLISYGIDDYVIVAVKDQKRQFWLITQKIDNQLFSNGRLSYVSNTQFYIQPKEKDFMLVYSQLSDQSLYYQTSVIKLDGGSSHLDCQSKIQFVKSKSILIQKLDTTLCFLKFNEAGNVILQDFSYKFVKNYITCMCQDAIYLFLADCDQQKFYIYKVEF